MTSLDMKKRKMLTWETTNSKKKLWGYALAKVRKVNEVMIDKLGR
jgi:hypothetical protein